MAIHALTRRSHQRPVSRTRRRPGLAAFPRRIPSRRDGTTVNPPFNLPFLYLASARLRGAGSGQQAATRAGRAVLRLALIMMMIITSIVIATREITTANISIIMLES